MTSCGTEVSVELHTVDVQLISCFVTSGSWYLACNSDLVIMIEANRTAVFILIVEHNRHGCFGDASLPLLVY